MCAAVALSGVQCVQDLLSPSPPGTTWVLSEQSALNDSVNIGDTIAAPQVQLAVNGTVVNVEFRATVLTGSNMAILPDGRLAVLGPGDANISVRPVSAALPPDTVLEVVFNLHAVVPRLGATGPDTLYSVGDTALMAATPESRTGAPLAGIPVTWSIESGDSAVQLLDAAAGRFRAIKNGDAVLRAASDTANATRTIRVRQRAASVDPTVPNVTLRAIGQLRQLDAQVYDARLNNIAGASTTWTTRNAAVATVTTGGLVNAAGPGSTYVVVTSTAGGGQSIDSVQVVVEQGQLRAASPLQFIEQVSIGQPAPEPFAVQLVDGANNDLADSGVAVTFTVISGDGTFGGAASTSLVTNGNGRAQALMVLGTNLDDDSVQVTAPGLLGQPLVFVARPAQPARLVFGTQPTATVAGAVIAPAPTVSVRDTFGAVVTSFGGQATVSLDISAASGPPPAVLAGAQLLGTLTRSFVNGVATFPDLTPDQVGQGFRLAASSGAMQPDTSTGFNVSAGAAAKLVFSQEPQDGLAGQALAQVEVTVLDAFDNPVLGHVGDVTLTIGTVPAGGTNQLFGTTTVGVTGGAASFADLVIPVAASGYRLRAAATGLPSVLSASFNIAGVADTIVLVSGNNQSALAGQPLGQPFVVEVRTAAGGPVAGDTVVFRRTNNDASFGGADTAFAITDALGRAGAQLTMAGSAPGNFAVEARSHSLPAQLVTFDFSLSPVGLELEFTTQPSNTTGGSPIAPTVVVRIKDALGNTQTGSNAFVTLSLGAGTGTAGAALAGTTTVQAVAGIATFSDVTVDSAGTGYRLDAGSAGITGATSSTFDVGIGAPAAVRFRAQPQSGTAGAPLAVFTAAVTDAGGNVVTGFAGDVTVAIAAGTGPAGANLRGTLQMPLSSGVATFDNVSVDSAGAAYSLQATLSGLTPATSASFAIVPAPPSRLAFLSQPASTTAGRNFNPTVTVAIRDSLGNLVTTAAQTVTLALQPNPTGATLLGTTSAAAVGGIATFTALRIRIAGSGYGLTAAAAGLSGDASAGFDIVPAPASALAFTTQPSNALPGAVITPAVVVAVRDSIGNLATGATNDVDLAITSGTGTATAALVGTLTRAAIGGLATFDDLAIDSAGTDYTLSATASGLTDAVSALFSILTAAADRLVFTTQPGAVEAGAPFSPAVAVEIQDGAGNLLTGRTDSVFIAITPGTGTSGANLRGGLRVAAVGGVAVFPDISLDSAGAAYQLTATSEPGADLGSATSTPFAVNPAPPIRLVFRTGPTSRTAGNPFSPALEVVVLDSLFNLVAGSTNEVTLSIVGGTGTTGAGLGGTVVQTAVNGVATFANVSIDSAGTGYQLQADSDTLTPALSGTFSITVGPIAQVSVQPGSLHFVAGGAGQQLSAVARDVAGNLVTGAAFVWSSASPALVAVDAAGLAVGLGSGQTYVRATSGGISGFAAVTVEGPAGIAPNLWTSVASPVSQNLRRIWGSGPSNVWAVGDGGTILHYNGNSWSQVTSPTSDQLVAVWGFSPSEAYAATTFGRIIRWNGTSWTSVLGNGTALMFGGWGVDPEAHWTVGSNGRIERFNGTTRSLPTSPVTQWLRGVYATSRNRAIAVGDNGVSALWDGVAWSSLATPAAGALTAVHGVAPDAVFAMDNAGIMLRFNGTAWSTLLSGTPANASVGIWATSRNEIFLAGPQALVWRSDSTGSSTVAEVGTQALRGVWAGATGDVWAVGDGGTLVRGVRGATIAIAPVSPTLTAFGATVTLTATARDAASQPVVVTGATTDWHSRNPAVASVDAATGLVTATGNGQTWILGSIQTADLSTFLQDSVQVTVAQAVASVAITPGSAPLIGIGSNVALSPSGLDANGNPVSGVSFTWASLNPAIATVHPSGVVTAVAPGQVIVAASSAAATGYALITVTAPGLAPVNLWAPEASGLAAISTITSFWGADAADVWAGSQGGGNLLRHTGSGWVAQNEPGTRGIWGSAANDIFRVNGGNIWHYDGTSWQSQLSLGNISFTDIWGSAPNNVFAVGSPFGGGVATVYRYDGTAWGPMSTPTTGSAGALNGIHGFGPDDVYAVGAPGVIRFDGTSWAVFPDPGTFEPRDIWGSSPTDMFIPHGGGIHRWNGTAWIEVLSTAGTHAHSVWGTSADEVFAPGDNGSMRRWNGSTFSTEAAAGSTITLGAIGGPGGAEVLVGGSDATILRGYRGATLQVTPASPTLTALGATTGLTATARSAANVVVPGAVSTWISRTPAVAAVDGASGLVTAVANGTAWIVATARGGVSDSTLVTVAQAVASIQVTPNAGPIVATGSVGLVADARDANGNPVAGAVAGWSSINPSIATVSATGNTTATATGVAGGQTAVRATAGAASGYAVITVAEPTPVPVNVWADEDTASANLSDVYADGPGSAWAVGEGGLVLHNATWSPIPSGTSDHLSAIHGSGPNDILAGTNQGTLHRYDGATWTDVFSNPGGGGAGIVRLWAASPNEAYAAHGAAHLSRFDGTTLVPVSTGAPAQLHAVWGSGPSDVWAVGIAGTVMRWNGTAWTQVPSGTTNNLTGIWGTGPDDVYVVGEAGTALHWNGAMFASIATGLTPGDGLGSVWGTAGGDLYASGTSFYRTYRYDGVTWSVSDPVGIPPLAYHGVGGGTVVAILGGGIIRRGYRGARVVATAPSGTLAVGGTFQPIASVEDAAFNPIPGVTITWNSLDPAFATVDPVTGVVTGVSPGTAGIVGTAAGGAADTISVTVAAVAAVIVSPNGALLTSGGATTSLTADARDAANNPLLGAAFSYTSMNPTIATVDPATGLVTSVSSGQATIAVTAGSATGYSLITVAFAGAAPVNLWSQVGSGTAEPIEDAWGVSGSEIYAVGQNSTRLRFNGSSWTVQSGGAFPHIFGIWGASATEMFAVGSGGQIWRMAADLSLTPMTSPVGVSLGAIWGSSPRDIFAVGLNGTIVRFDGQDWTQMTGVPTSENLSAVYGFSPTEVFAAGNNGTILRYDGADWTLMNSGTNATITSLWGFSSTNMYATGNNSLLFFSGGPQWTSISTVTGGLADLWGSWETDIVMAGGTGSVGLAHHFNGFSATEAEAPANLQAVWGTRSGEVHAFGEAGTIMRGFRGATVSITTPPPTLTALGATEPLAAEARDAGAQLIGGVAFTWSSSNTGVATVDPLTGVVTAVANGTATITATAPGGASGDVLVTVQQVAASIALGQPGVFLAGGSSNVAVTALDALGSPVTGVSFTCGSQRPAIATASFAGGNCNVTAVASGQATFFATDGTLTAYGTATVAIPGAAAVNLWAEETSNTTGTVNAFWGADLTDVWAGVNNTLLRNTGSGWVNQGTFISASAFWGFSGSDIFRVSGSAINRFDGNAWNLSLQSGTNTFTDVWGSAPNDVFAVGVTLGGPSTIMRWDGTSWQPMTVPNTSSLSGVYGFASNDVYAVGTGGTVFHYDGTQWTTFTSPSAENLNDVWGTSGSDLYVAGNFGIYRYTGTSWTQIVGPTSSRSAVWGTSSGDVYGAPGLAGVGTVDYWNGTATSLTTGNTSTALEGLWGLGTSSVLAGGTGGTILRGYRNASVVITTAPPTLTSLGDTVTLVAEGRTAGMSPIGGVTFAWTSLNSAVATVTTAGLVTAVANGTASIVATAPGGTADTVLVTVVLNELWTWMSGSSSGTAQNGVYGTRGVPDPANVPGTRQRSVSWTDASGNLWLFGGFGRDAFGANGILNDLWRFDGNNWTWISGSNSVNQLGVYGTPGIPDPANVPGARQLSVTWTDGGSLWLFGGSGNSSTGFGRLNDLWRFDGANWTWISGSNSADQLGVYGTLGVPDPGNVPGSRFGSVSWHDGGALWLFGGDGMAAAAQGRLNDLWRFDGANWTWISGSSSVEQPGVYGTMGISDPGNVPGGRHGSISWYDGTGLWLFGGDGRDASGNAGSLNDLWRFNGSSWAWVSGSSSANQQGVYGTRGVPAPGNLPGGRTGAVSWTQGPGVLWLFGGLGFSSAGNGAMLNDLWRFDGTNWTWVSGSTGDNAMGVYGTLGVPDPGNVPGARHLSVSWKDAAGNFWLFGGSPFGASHNDLWRFTR